jgi:transcriptional/translational regulatory protein YebC/TACO1
MGNPGSVAYMFQTKGQIFIDAGKRPTRRPSWNSPSKRAPRTSRNPRATTARWTILTDPTDFLAVKEALEAAGIEIADSELTKIPDNTVAITGRRRPEAA